MGEFESEREAEGELKHRAEQASHQRRAVSAWEAEMDLGPLTE